MTTGVSVFVNLWELNISIGLNKMTTYEDKLREEFQAFVEAGLWQGEDEYTKNMPVGNVTDFFIAKHTQYLAELREEIEKINIDDLVNEWEENCCDEFKRRILALLPTKK